VRRWCERRAAVGTEQVTLMFGVAQAVGGKSCDLGALLPRALRTAKVVFKYRTKQTRRSP
jgi:hypothetical protein